jgi:MoaA/NifB/PqqE/SkfB family radical SAM enzyme
LTSATELTYRESPGLELTLELGNFCPLACLHCSQDAGPFRTDSLTLAKSLEIVREARTLGADTIAISGGEPLCSPNFIPVCELAKSLGLRVFVYTAGSVIDKDTLSPISNSLVHHLVQLGIDRIIVNLQAAERELHDKITGRRGSYENAISSMRKLISAELRVEIHFVPMKDNFHELSAVAELAKELGVAQINVIRFVPQGRGLRNSGILQLEREDYSAFRQIVTTSIASSEVPIRVSEAFAFLHLKFEYQCQAARKKIVVSGDGAVCPCSAFKGILRQNPAYNVNERSLFDISNSGIFWSLRSHNSLYGVNCGCPAQRLIADGKIGPGADSNCLTHAVKTVTKNMP